MLEMESSLARARKPDGSTRFFSARLGPSPNFFDLILYEKSGWPELGPSSARLFSARQGPSPTVEGSTPSLGIAIIVQQLLLLTAIKLSTVSTPRNFSVKATTNKQKERS